MALATEGEAHQKWCPFAATGTPVQASQGGKSVIGIASGVNRGNNEVIAACLCIGSKCNAWQWAAPPQSVEDRKTRGDRRLGYCGLAGDPGPGDVAPEDPAATT